MTNAETLLELATRAVAAKGADRELDEVLETLLRPLPSREDGWFRSSAGHFECHHLREAFTEHFVARRYTAFRDHALLLVPDDHVWASGSCGEENMPWACVTQNGAPCRDFSADAASEALALTAAALKARAHASQSREPSK